MSQNLFNDVSLFLRTAGKPGGPGHQHLVLDSVIESTRHCGEEYVEMCEAQAKWLMTITTSNDPLEHDAAMAQLADAYIDSIYTAMNGLWALGLDPKPLWDIVQAANMAKFPLCPHCTNEETQDPGCMLCHGEGRIVKKDAKGKVLKPDGWVPPDAALAAEILRQANAK